MKKNKPTRAQDEIDKEISQLKEPGVGRPSKPKNIEFDKLISEHPYLFNQKKGFDLDNFLKHFFSNRIPNCSLSNENEKIAFLEKIYKDVDKLESIINQSYLKDQQEHVLKNLNEYLKSFKSYKEYNNYRIRIKKGLEDLEDHVKINFLKKCKQDLILDGVNPSDKKYQFIERCENMFLNPGTKYKKITKLPKRTDVYDTVLTQKQISLFAYFLRKNRFILPNTTYTLLASCFGKMADFSETQINKDYKGMTEITDISTNSKDYEKLIYELKELIIKIETYKSDNEKNGNIK